MGKEPRKPGPKPRSPIGKKAVRGFGEGGSSGDPPGILAEKEAKRTKDWMDKHKA